MPRLAEVSRRMSVRRVVAAADLPADEAHPEVHPRASDLRALLAHERFWRKLGDGDRVEMGALVRHGLQSCLMEATM